MILLTCFYTEANQIEYHLIPKYEPPFTRKGGRIFLVWKYQTECLSVIFSSLLVEDDDTCSHHEENYEDDSSLG